MTQMIKLLTQLISNLSVIISMYACDPDLTSSIESDLLSDEEENIESRTPDEVQSAFTAPQELTRATVILYCEDCPSANACEATPEREALTLDEARCLLTESSEIELRAFLDYQECILAATRVFSACVNSAPRCEESALGVCSDGLTMSASRCVLDPVYRDRVGITCFSERPDFVCDDGQTIEGEWVCDGEPDCRDRSDEEQGC